MATRLPQWDLSDLYSGIDDPKIEKDFKRLVKAAQKFEMEFRKKLKKTISAKKLLEALSTFERIRRDRDILSGYAEMIFSTHSNDSEYQAFLQKVRSYVQEIERHLVFFEVGLAKLPVTYLRKLSKSSALENYSHYLQKQVNLACHRLTEAEEQIVNEKELVGPAALRRLFEQEFAVKHFDFELKGKTKQMGQSEILHLLHDSDQKIRKAAAKGLTKGLSEEVDRVAFIHNMLAYDHLIEDRYRSFDSPEASRHLENEVDQEVVDAMVSTVRKQYSLVQDYYTFKKNVLGLRTLHDYDRYAPIATSNVTYTFKQAKEIVLEAFASFSPTFARVAEKFFDNGWIDAQPRSGKRGGAYCIYIAPNKHPYVMVNFSGSIRDVMTLAHELGHAVNGYLARKQTHLNFDWPLTIAETASVFGEMLVFDSLKKKHKDNPRELLSLYIQTIEDSFSTVSRQVSMFMFERAFHAERRQVGELSAKRINELWRQSQEEMFGNSVNLSKGYDLWWSYIPHFIHWPFYVYAYALGQLLSLSLYAEYERRGEDMVSAYMKFMEAGGSASPDELVTSLGVDWRRPEFWEEGMDEIAKLISEAKQLHKTL